MEDGFGEMEVVEVVMVGGGSFDGGCWGNCDPSTRALCGSRNPSPVGLRDWPTASPHCGERRPSQ